MRAQKAHSLIGQVYDRRNLQRAWERVKQNRGVGGVDGVTIARFDEKQDHYLDVLHQQLKEAATGHGPSNGSRSTSPGPARNARWASRP